jgi:hypothetical protein
MVTYHPWYHSFRPEIASSCLAETAELGAGYIRIDIRWKDLIPDGRNVDEVAHRAGSLCSVYQVLNEPTNFVYNFFPAKMTAAAILLTSKVIRQHNSSAQITINVLAGLWRWQSDLEGILRECGSAVDIVGLDYYPGTWTVSHRTDSFNWNQFIEFIAQTKETSASPLSGRPMAIIETGYATNLQPWRSEKQQANYFRTLENAVMHLDARIGRDGLAMVGIHELSDSDTHAFLDPEAHFGLLTSDTLRRKAAFDVVGRIFSAVQ